MKNKMSLSILFIGLITIEKAAADCPPNINYIQYRKLLNKQFITDKASGDKYSLSQDDMPLVQYSMKTDDILNFFGQRDNHKKCHYDMDVMLHGVLHPVSIELELHKES